jgi:hypothetical protein
MEFAIDVGRAHDQRRQLQNVADGTFKAGDVHSCTSSMNAVEVSVTRSVPTTFARLMLAHLCDEAIKAGGYVSSGTGSAQIDQVFESLLADTAPPLASRNMVAE